MKKIGVVVIGRNEGNRLYQCLMSVLSEETQIVYVDSGSTDSSVALTQSLGIPVVELDLSIPFTAARARNAGFEYLLQVEPNIEFVQFVDGDCRVVEGWLASGLNKLLDHPDVVVVCGRRKEELPNESIYNRMCDIEWDTPVGEAKACGGDFIVRVTAFKNAGGFNPILIAGEEPELCLRLRQAGGKILRIDADMSVHDARITNFNQWWKRSLRSGHAYAEGSWIHGRTPEKYWVKESCSIWYWGLLLPLLGFTTAWVTFGLSLVLLLIAYVFLVHRIYKNTLYRGISSEDALIYSLFCVLGKFPQVQGQIKFHISRLLKRRSNLVEYKVTAPC